MSSISEDYLDEFQHDHLSFEHELEQCRLDALARLDELGPNITANLFFEDAKSALQAAAKHEMLKDTAFHGLIRHLRTCTDRHEFEAAIGDTINHLRDR